MCVCVCRGGEGAERLLRKSDYTYIFAAPCYAKGDEVPSFDNGDTYYFAVKGSNGAVDINLNMVCIKQLPRYHIIAK